MNSEPRNVLVFDLGQLGDVVLSLPALSAIRKQFPQARITVACGLAAALVVRMSGTADRTMAIDRLSLRDGPKLRAILRLVRLVAEVRRARYDMVIDLHSLSESNLLGYISGAPVRLYAQRRRRSLDFLATIRAPMEDTSKHQVDRYLDVLVPLGITGAPRIPRLHTRAEDDRTVQQILEERGATSAPLVGFFPGAGRTHRRWPLERFVDVGLRLEKRDGAHVVVFLGPEETAVASQVRAAFSPSTLVMDGLTLSQFASAAARLDLLISNDTGPMHLAAAVGTPILLLLGAPVQGPYWFAPVAEHHQIVRRVTLAHVTVTEVYDAAHSLLQSARRGRQTLPQDA